MTRSMMGDVRLICIEPVNAALDQFVLSASRSGGAGVC